MPSGFDELERVLVERGAEAAFGYLAEKFRDEKKYPQLFNLRVMKRRFELGLPLLEIRRGPALAAEIQRELEEAYVAAAREVGGLFLADGDIVRAWPYFRAIGDAEPVAAALEKEAPREGNDALLEIAFNEGVHPYKGLELILAQYGVCRAISFFEQYPGGRDRDRAALLLIRTMHAELAAALRRTIAAREGESSESVGVSELVAGRDWLFGEYDTYIDTSHVVYGVRLAAALEEREAHRLALELTDYGRRLSRNFQLRGDPPFDDVFVDYGVYLRALLGEEVEAALEHFRQKLAASGPDTATPAAEVLVGLLARLGRYREALEVALHRLRDYTADQLACPSIPELCQLAGDLQPLGELAREQGDLLHFAAARLAAGKESA